MIKKCPHCQKITDDKRLDGIALVYSCAKENLLLDFGNRKSKVSQIGPLFIVHAVVNWLAGKTVPIL